jgi:hypothetical protein
VRFAWLFVLVSLVACDDGPFADPAHPTAEECDAIEQRWLDVIDSLDRSCDTADDCVVVGGGDCEGQGTSLGGPYGTAVNRAAYDAARSRVSDALEGWGSCTCDLVGCFVDEQPGSATCPGGACAVVDDNLCNPPP